MRLVENPIIRMLAVLIAVVAGIRLIYELLAPVLPYLAVGVVLFAVWRVVHWYRRRW
jgi:hypothetical protein